MINGLDLFSGYGGIARALRRRVRTIAYCEVDRYAQGVLLSEMRRGRIDQAPIWDDVRTLRKEHIIEPIDIICGGSPCQDFSFAGAGRGLDGERSGLVFEFLRLIGEFRPQYGFMENVPAIAVRGLDRILLGLDALGYDARWTIVSAAEMGAPHLRERWWLLAHPKGVRPQEWNSERQRSQDARARTYATPSGVVCGIPWGGKDLSDLRRAEDGTPHWMHRIRTCGNGVVPDSAEEAFQRLIGF